MHPCFALSMKKPIPVQRESVFFTRLVTGILISFTVPFAGLFYSQAQTLDVFSDGALISVYSDSVIIDGNFLHGNNDTIFNSGNIYLTGNWTNNNPSGNVFASGPDGWLHLSGAAQTIDGSTVTHFNNLKLSGTGIKQLAGIDAEVEDTLALGDREFSVSGNTVFVLNTATGAVSNTTIPGSEGFVSSTSDGGLSRQTLSTGNYMFPVGSSSGTLRYRPVDLTPNASSANTFKVRMANVNPTTEGYDVNIKDTTLCEVNSFYYHRIFRTSGTTPADIKFYFDATADGNFATSAHWQNIPQWENTTANVLSGGSPFSTLTKSSWNNFSTNPFALAKPEAPVPVITASGPTAFCTGDSVILDAGSGYATYLWSNGEVSQTIVVTASGNFSVTVTNSSGCSSSSSAATTITVNNAPVPTITPLGGSNTICDGTTETLDAGVWASYLWSDGSTTQTIAINDSGTYAVSVTSGNGCSGDTSLFISVSTFPDTIIMTSGPTVFCSGNQVTLDAGSGFASYLWNTGDTTQTIDVDSSGNYNVLVTDSIGCVNDSAITFVAVTVNPAPVLSVSPDDTINLGQSDTLVASGAVNYTWEPGSGSGSTFIVSPQEETTYIVTGTDANGCTDIDTVTVFVDTKCVYWIPNIFSPNGDFENDELRIYGRGLEWVSLNIFDRWGNMVFESTDVSTPWDGKFKGNGKVLNTGVYVYILKGKCLSTGEEFEQHGNTTLTR